MSHDDFEILQTFLLYGSPDPMDFGREFASLRPFEVGDFLPHRHYGQSIANLTC